MPETQTTFEPMRSLIPRPRKDDDVIRAKALDRLQEDVTEWLDGEDEDGPERTRKELDEACRYHRDGYEIARELESNGWSPDEGLVEILGGWSSTLDSAHREAVERWIAECEIKPQLEPGTRVKVKDQTGIVEGVIQPSEKWNLSRAQYLVRRDTDGRPVTIKGKPSLGSRTLGVNINYEDILEVLE